jgi:hypothetical protein
MQPPMVPQLDGNDSILKFLVTQIRMNDGSPGKAPLIIYFGLK